MKFFYNTAKIYWLLNRNIFKIIWIRLRNRRSLLYQLIIIRWLFVLDDKIYAKEIDLVLWIKERYCSNYFGDDGYYKEFIRLVFHLFEKIWNLIKRK